MYSDTLYEYMVWIVTSTEQTLYFGPNCFLSVIHVCMEHLEVKFLNISLATGFVVFQSLKNTNKHIFTFALHPIKSFSKEKPIFVNCFVYKLRKIVTTSLLNIHFFCFDHFVADSDFHLVTHRLHVNNIQVTFDLILNLLILFTSRKLFPIFVEFKVIFLLFYKVVKLFHIQISLFADNEHWDFVIGFHLE